VNLQNIKKKAYVNGGVGVLVGIVSGVPTLLRHSPLNASSGDLLFPILTAASSLGYTRDRRYKSGWRLKKMHHAGGIVGGITKNWTQQKMAKNQH